MAAWRGRLGERGRREAGGWSTYDLKGREENQRYTYHVNDYVYGVVVISTVLRAACRQPHEPTDEAIPSRPRVGRVSADEVTAVALTKVSCLSRSRDMVAAVSEGRTRRGVAGLFAGLSGWPDQRLRHETRGEPARRQRRVRVRIEGAGRREDLGMTRQQGKAVPVWGRLCEGCGLGGEEVGFEVW